MSGDFVVIGYDSGTGWLRWVQEKIIREDKFKKTIGQGIGWILFMNHEITKSDDKKSGGEKEILK